MTGGNVVGVDSSLTSTGIAGVRPDGRPALRAAGRAGRKGAPVADQARRIHAVARDVLRYLPVGTALLVIEGPSLGSTFGNPHERAGLWWAIVGGAVSRGIPVAVVAPATRAKWATTSGKADKAAVVAAMRQLWPDLNVTQHDRADALALATIGAQRLGWPVPQRAWHAASLDAVRWPADLPVPSRHPVPVGAPS